MIKTILDWIFGKKDSEVKPAEAPVPYKVEASVAEAPAPVVEVAAPVVEAAAPAPAPVVETATVTVKAKYKKAELTKMTKAQLMELITKHGVEVKSRATKEELVKLLSRV